MTLRRGLRSLRGLCVLAPQRLIMHARILAARRSHSRQLAARGIERRCELCAIALRAVVCLACRGERGVGVGERRRLLLELGTRRGQLVFQLALHRLQLAHTHIHLLEAPEVLNLELFERADALVLLLVELAMIRDKRLKAPLKRPLVLPELLERRLKIA